ncbi:M17 family metallopeptidase [uncultured Jatrophihabitans sp.]|uniref:leucyl aminopeptidase family protein n=1 Tax=uncultured Jatrophihabitans sp. TaxID=1610747 RepID=UPI0035CB0EFB
MVDVRLAGPAKRTPTGERPDESDLPHDLTQLRRRAGTLARGLPAGRAEVDGDGLAAERLAAFAEGLVLGCYRFDRASRPRGGADEIDVTGPPDDSANRRAVAAGVAAAQATVWARELANVRSGEKNPAWLAAEAQRTLTPLGVDVQTRDVDWLRAHGFGGVLAVGGGSASPPRLIEASWRPRRAQRGVHVVLVGKGITFDTGGLNRKTGTGMNTMHTDMAGGAAVLGALRLVAEHRLPVRVTALVPAAENALSGSSYRPGDVVRHVGGRTSEIANTDAEGRIVLADALAYAAARLRPTHLIDIATLTGAMKTALGLRIAGLFATSDELARALLAAAEEADEPLWRMPMPAEYAGLLDSSVADANNAPGSPGAITAALFLRPFAGDVAWAHLDIAGPARAAKDDGAVSRGATGFGVRLLHRFVQSLG